MEFIQGDGFHQPFGSKVFGLVLSVNIVNIMDHLEQVIDELSCVFIPRGAIDLTTLVKNQGFGNGFQKKRGFRDLFSTTVYGYIRKLRTKRALTLLQTSDCNLTEAAMASGYSS